MDQVFAKETDRKGHTFSPICLAHIFLCPPHFPPRPCCFSLCLFSSRILPLSVQSLRVFIHVWYGSRTLKGGRNKLEQNILGRACIFFSASPPLPYMLIGGQTQTSTSFQVVLKRAKRSPRLCYEHMA